MGIDLGERRIGIAVSDATGTLASPAGVLHRGPRRSDDHASLAATAAELGAEVVVVGLPLSLSGQTGPAARRVLEEVEELRQVLTVPVHVQDERLSTVTADRALRGQSRGAKGTASARRRSGRIDQAAAAVLLQAWLDGRRP